MGMFTLTGYANHLVRGRCRESKNGLRHIALISYGVATRVLCSYYVTIIGLIVNKENWQLPAASMN